MSNSTYAARRPWDVAWSHPDPAWFESEGFQEAVLASFSAVGRPTSPILDAGCGRGTLLSRLRGEYSSNVFGADLSLASLRQGPGGCVQASATDLPFSHGAFGSVVAVLLLEHLPDYRAFLAEAYRVLRPKGRVYLVFPNRHSLVTPALAIRRMLGRQTLPWHRPLSRFEAARALAGAGFTAVRTDYLSIGAYRGGFDKLASALVEALLPHALREEIVMIGERP